MMNTRVIDGVAQIDRATASDGILGWFDNRVEELYGDNPESAACLMKHASGKKVAEAQKNGGESFLQLVYDCCCEQAWEETKEKWVNGELS